MNAGTTARLLAFGGLFVCLLVAAVGVVGGAEDDRDVVAVAWPHLREVDPGTTHYRIDVAVEAEGGSLFLLHYDPATGRTVAVDELPEAGAQDVDFPVAGGAGRRNLVLVHCPTGVLGAGCTYPSASPAFTLEEPSDPGSAATPGDLTVGWTGPTELNPDRTPYAVDVQWGGAGSLFLVGTSEDGTRTLVDEVRGTGPHPVEFPAGIDGSDFRLRMLRCPGKVLEEACAPTGRGVDIEVWRSFEVSAGADVLGPRMPVPFELRPHPTRRVSVDWEVRDGDEVVVEGTARVRPDRPLPPLGRQPSLEDGGHYELTTSVEGTAAPYGPLAGASEPVEFRWDAVGDRDARVQVGWFERGAGLRPSSIFYPVPDGYRDHLRFAVPSAPEDLAGLEVEVRDATGAVVFTGRDTTRRGGLHVDWDGRGSTGAALPTGSYEATASVFDEAANRKVTTRSIEVSHRQVVRRVWSKTFPAAEVGVQDLGETCGWRKQPARAEWPGSVGFYTADTCGDAAVSRVSAIYRVDAPESLSGRYGRVRVIVQGGASPRDPESALAIRYWSGEKRRDAGPSRQLNGFDGAHSGGWSPAGVYEVGGRPFVRWEVAAARGDRYDVQSFTVQVEYDVLE